MEGCAAGDGFEGSDAVPDGGAAKKPRLDAVQPSKAPLSGHLNGQWRAPQVGLELPCLNGFHARFSNKGICMRGFLDYCFALKPI